MGASARDEFSEPVRRELRERVAGLCSAPSCRKPTLGPSDTSSRGISDVGVAAHITAAASGGPRYDRSLSRAQRASAINGIWLCHTHGRLVDNDYVRYSAELLRAWRRVAEERAARALEGAPPLGGFFTNDAQLDHETLRVRISDFLEDIGVAASFGRDLYLAVDRLLKEVALNAFEHAGAHSVGLSSSADEVLLSHVGTRFGWDDLRTSTSEVGHSGGRWSLDQLERAFSGEVVLSHTHDGRLSTWRIADLRGLADVPSDPCVVTMRKAAGLRPEDLAAFGDCERVHVFLEWNVMHSDARRLVLETIGPHVRDEQLVIHGLRSGDPLRDALSEWFPNARIADN